MGRLLPLFLVLVSGLCRLACPNELSYVSCSQDAAEMSFRFRARIVLARRFLDPHASDEQNLRAGISHQFKYLSGYFYNHPSEVRLVVSEPPKIIRLETIDEQAYPYGMKIDYVRHPQVEVSDPYMKRALAIGKTVAGEPALSAEYVAEARAVICHDGSRLLSQVRFALPLDPYLAYWQVPPDQRRPLRWRSSFWIANPCASSEIADFPDPFYYWYFWQPNESGFDFARNPFSCDQLLRPGKDFQFVVAEMIGREPPSLARNVLEWPGDHRRKTASIEPLLFGIIFGRLDFRAPALPLAAFERALREARGTLSERVAAFEREDLAGEKIELGAVDFLTFLRRLDDVLEITAFQPQRFHHTVVLGIEGRLRGSRRAMRMQVSFGPTDVFGEMTPEHWSLARRALANDEIVIYNGHSGLGENMALQRIAGGVGIPRAQMEREVARRPYQLVAYLSCYSQSYFGTDLLRARGGRGRLTQLVTTGSSFNSPEIAIGILELVDDTLNQYTLTRGPQLANRLLRASDFLILKTER